MKVLHILYELKFSGAEIMYVDAAPIFQKKGCELSVMAIANELGEYAPYFRGAGYEVMHYAMPALNNIFGRLNYYKKIVKLLQKEQFEVVHIHSSIGRFGFAMCAWRAGIRSVYTFHNVFKSRSVSYPLHFIQRSIIKKLFKCRFQTISDSVHDNELNEYHNETVKVYNWYGNARYFPAIEGESMAVRKELGISEQTLVLISVGGCSPVKRHTDIIKALPLILETIPDCLYLHLGKGCSEEEEIKLANELGVSANVRFCGNQENVRKYLIASDLYLMPSRFEGISITTIEAMACKTPAILYDVPGLRDFNKSGINSILIVEDYELLAETIVNIAADKKEMIDVSERAEQFVNTLFNMQNNASKIYELYL